MIFTLFHFEQLCIRFLTMDDQEISAVKIRYIVRIVWVSIFQKYSKFWSISEEDNFIKDKHLSSKEWTTLKPHGKKKLSKTSMYYYIILLCVFFSQRQIGYRKKRTGWCQRCGIWCNGLEMEQSHVGQYGK